MAMEDINWKNPKLIAAGAVGTLAVLVLAYNFMGGKPGVPLNQVETTEQTLIDISARTLLAVQAGSTPKAVAELPPSASGATKDTDAWGSTIALKLEGTPKQKWVATITSPGEDKTANTPDDVICVTTYDFIAGPGYDLYVSGRVEFPNRK